MKINKDRKYLIACSGGPDSMALLDMCFKAHYKIEVAHVNYHKRQSADRDEKIVSDYCLRNNITFNKLDFNPNVVKGNFQSYARKARYDWFAFICEIHNLDNVLVAHQQDDLIETYLMQKNKKLGVKEYGLASSNTIYGARVIRPLLDKTKKQLQDYCDKHSIEYGIDESNLTDHYARNIVRHNKVEKMTNEERENIILEIYQKNIEILTIKNNALKYIYSKDKYPCDEFVELPYAKQVIREIFDISMSDKYLEELLRQLKQAETFKLKRNNIYLVKEYGYVYYFKDLGNYSFKVNEGELFYTDFFKIQRTGKDNMSCAHVSKDDFPLTIRNYKEGDCIQMRYGTKKINRFFIDNKIAFKDRLIWPIVLNKKGIAILVPGIGCNIDHYDKKPNIFVIKL